MTELVFLDIETTGLHPGLHKVWEIAYAINDGPILSSVVNHTLGTADPKALELNGHADRCGCRLGEPNPDQVDGYAFERELRLALVGNTIVGANPAFDTKFLRERWRDEPWHHRMIDLESYAMPYLALDRPLGLSGIAHALTARKPDHSAAGDVATLRECWLLLRDEYKA